MSRRTLEQLNIRKQQKVVVAKGYPSESEGANGEIQVRITRDNGIMLFVRALGKWHSTPLQIRHVSKKRDRIILQQGRAAKYPGELAVNSTGQVQYKSSSAATPRTILDNISDIGSFTIQAADSNEGYLIIKGGITNGAASLRFFPDKGADAADKFQIYAEDAATEDGLRFAKISSADGSRVDLMKMTYGTGDAAANSQVSIYPPVVCSSTIQATNASFTEVTAGAVVWESFPFITNSIVAGRHYYRDVDDPEDFRVWDDYDTDPTGFSYLDVPGQYVVPEDCTLKAMSAVVTNFSSTTDVTLTIYHGTPNLDTTSDTTLAVAGTATTISISTFRVAYAGSATYSVNLNAGDIIVPTVSHTNAGASQTIRGNITLKFLTR